MNLPTEFALLFAGNQNVYGRNQLQEGYNDNGKRKSSSWLKKEPVTEHIWIKHLSGSNPIGIVPIREDNTVVFGVIDVDVYNNQISFKKLIQCLDELPFVVLRSKSGGAHLYLFLKEPVPAKLMIAKLSSFAAWLGFGDCEIFPKQTALGEEESDSRYGNWIMMPYDGQDTLRYAVNEEEQPLSPQAFVVKAKTKAISLEELKNLTPPLNEIEILPDGPPCLNYIFKERTAESEMRNTTLANAAVYLKKANPDQWKEKLNELNNKFTTPLPDAELNSIKKSYEKKDYKYQCSKVPLCRYCDSGLCKTKKYGVSKNSILPSNRSLTKLNTSPPIWFLNLDDRRIQLDTEQLFDFRRFSLQVLQCFNYIPEPCKNDEWRETVNALTANCTIIDIPEEMTPAGILKEAIVGFLLEATTKSYEDILRGIPFKDLHNITFRTKDLTARLKRDRVEFKLNELTNILQEEPFFAQRKFIRIGKSGVNCWVVKNQWEIPVLEPQQPEIIEPY